MWHLKFSCRFRHRHAVHGSTLSQLQLQKQGLGKVVERPSAHLMVQWSAHCSTGRLAVQIAYNDLPANFASSAVPIAMRRLSESCSEL